MPIIKRTVWMARCDKCRKEVEGSFLPFAETKRKLLDYLEDRGWEIHGKTIYCFDCAGEFWNEDGTPKGGKQ